MKSPTLGFQIAVDSVMPDVDLMLEHEFMQSWLAQDVTQTRACRVGLPLCWGAA